MKEALNANTLFNTVAMARQGISSPILVTEGDDDHFVLKEHKSDDLYLIRGVGGRPTVLAAAALAEKYSIKGVKFLADADYEWLVDPARSHPENVILSQHHDLFMDLIVAGPHIIDWVIETHRRSALRQNGDDGTQPSALRDKAIELAARLAPLRIVNERKVLQLNLKNFPISKFNSLEPTVEAIAEIAIARSDTTLSVSELIVEIESETTHKAVGNIFLVGDHDFFRALARVLLKYGAKAVSDSALLDSFISALTCSLIMATRLYISIVQWCESYGYAAFRCPCQN